MSLEWYYRVSLDEAPAKFLLLKIIDAGQEPDKMADKELQNLHARLNREFKDVFQKASRLSLQDLRMMKKPDHSYLDVKIEIAKRIIRKCRLCERRCGIDRTKERGVCRLMDRPYVSSYFLHMGEEPPLIPSGTIFYGSCNFRCAFCQNYDISQENPFSGTEVNAETLAEIQEDLRRRGARNINHVGGEPTPNIHVILESLKNLETNVPQLWNSNMYLTAEALELIHDVIDIWLPDLKYGNDECAKRLSSAENYYDVVTRNLGAICGSGDPIIIRHLVLPNHIKCCTEPALRWIGENCKNALVNVMAQYRPEYRVLRNPERYMDVARRPSREEISEAYSIARRYGLNFEEVS